MDIGSAILDFCINHEVVLAYGAGAYATKLNWYLQEQNVKISACLVSGKAPTPPVFMGYVPIYSLSDFPIVSGVRYGIILALESKHHKEVTERLHKHFQESVNILPLTEKNIEELECLAQNIRRDNVLYKPDCFSTEEITSFDARISEITRCYQSILLRYINVYTIGALGWSWMRARMERGLYQDNRFHLYYPIVWYGCEELDSPNDTLLYRESAPGVEVISKINIRFWRYFLGKHKSLFQIVDDFSRKSDAENFCRFALDHQQVFPGKFIFFTPDEEREAASFCQKEMHLHEPFAAFLARDSLYTDTVRNKPWKQDTHLIHSVRNSPLENFKLAMEHLGKQGLQTVRMGAVVSGTVDWKGTVDYAHDYRSEFMDLYLSSRCSFFVSNMSGIQSLPQLFKKPLVAIAVPFLTQRGDYLLFSDRGRDLAIYRKCWDEKEKRYLTFKEMLSYEVDDFFTDGNLNAAHAYKAMGLVSLDNTPEEIDDVVQEMYARLQGTMEYTAEDEELQQRFFDIIDSFPMKKNFPFMFRVGAKFLRQNRWLLD